MRGVHALWHALCCQAVSDGQPVTRVYAHRCLGLWLTGYREGRRGASSSLVCSTDTLCARSVCRGEEQAWWPVPGMLCSCCLFACDA